MSLAIVNSPTFLLELFFFKVQTTFFGSTVFALASLPRETLAIAIWWAKIGLLDKSEAVPMTTHLGLFTSLLKTIAAVDSSCSHAFKFPIGIWGEGAHALSRQ